jgi:hypothetical protein
MPKRLNHLYQQSKAEAYQRIEAILDEGPFVPGTHAVHRAYFLYGLRWSQAGARISEMNDLGWTITSLLLPESEWQSGVRTAYRLDSKPLRSKQEPSESEYMRRMRQEQAAAMPLFAGVRE